VNRFFAIPCLSLTLFACGDDDGDDRSTHEVVDATIEGLCAKLDMLECAQPNCEEGLELAGRNCDPRDVQALLDCAAIATFMCADDENIDGDPEIPRTRMCESEFFALASCSQ
jgi:hypothetical protein